MDEFYIGVGIFIFVVLVCLMAFFSGELKLESEYRNEGYNSEKIFGFMFIIAILASCWKFMLPVAIAIAGTVYGLRKVFFLIVETRSEYEKRKVGK